MNLADWTIRKSLLAWVITVLFLVVGWNSYQQLSRLEDPEFTIKDAVIMTQYSGASAAEVEEEVTNVIEKAVQEMGQLKKVESRSSRGLSLVQVTMQDKFDKASLPQVWDELRRKVNDAQRSLPPGAGPSLVNDDFGDVYGIFYYSFVTLTTLGYGDILAVSKQARGLTVLEAIIGQLYLAIMISRLVSLHIADARHK